MSAAEDSFNAAWLKIAPEGHDLTREFVFHPERKWRLDFAFPSQRLAIEIQGRGRHQTVVGARNDAEKCAEAMKKGWRILYIPATDIRVMDDWARHVLEILIGDKAA